MLLPPENEVAGGVACVAKGGVHGEGGHVW